MAPRRPGRACRNSDRETPEEERHHSCQLILVLSPVLEETIVAASIVVHRFYRLSLPTQCGLELSRHLHRCDRVPPVRRAIGGAMEYQYGNVELGRMVRRLSAIPAGMDDDGLYWRTFWLLIFGFSLGVSHSYSERLQKRHALAHELFVHLDASAGP